MSKKLADENDKPSESAIESRLLSSLPQKFSPFRMAWECTPKAERSKEDLIARLLQEDKRIVENENATSLALQIEALDLRRKAKAIQGTKERKVITSRKSKS